MALKYLPAVDWSKKTPQGGVTEAATLNQTAMPAAESQLTVAAENALLRVTYGEDRIGAQIANVASYNGGWVYQAVWGEGQIEQIVELTANDKALPAGAVATHYVGSQSQGVDPTLAAAISGYADTLPGIAYSVVFVPGSSSDGFAQIAARIKGRLLYDPRTGLTVYSDNPALALADYRTNTVYGMGLAVDWDDVAIAADACDELVGGEKRRIIGLTITENQAPQAWIDTLRTYAGCWTPMEGANMRLVPDRPRATDATITHAAGQIKRLRWKKRDILQAPTVVTIRYTDTSAIPWRDAQATAYAPGVLAGTTDRRESEVALPGVHRHSQANREATERLNKLWLCDLSVEIEEFDEATARQVGDVIELTHPDGFSAKPLRVLAVAGEYGDHKSVTTEYDPAVYCDEVVAGPTFPDTDLPSPLNPPTLTGLTVVEEVYQLENGTWASRIRATWTAPTWPYLQRYVVEVWSLNKLIASATADQPEWASAAIQEGQYYTVRVCVVSSIGAAGAWAAANLTAQGKGLIPGNVASVSVFEAGGRVYVSWPAAIDLDIWRYEVRYGSGTWDAATLIDRVDSLRLTSDQIPVGTWTIFVKAIDSIGQYSTTAATALVTVTSDASSFMVDAYDQTAPVLTNMVEYRLGRANPNRYFVTEDGVALGTKMPGALSAYPGILATHHAAVTSTWLGEAEDFGQVLGGNWAGTATVADISGSHDSYVGFSDDGAAYTYQNGLSHKTTARFARMKHESLAAATLLVTIPTQQIRLDAVPRSEVGLVAVAATGITTVDLAGEYAAVKSIQLTPQGTAARAASWDSVSIGDGRYMNDGYVDADYVAVRAAGFDVYLFDDTQARVAGDVYYRFEGV